MDKPPLERERLRAALCAIEMESSETVKVFDSVHVEVFKAACEFILRARPIAPYWVEKPGE